jgi:hypothetical protein
MRFSGGKPTLVPVLTPGRLPGSMLLETSRGRPFYKAGDRVSAVPSRPDKGGLADLPATLPLPRTGRKKIGLTFTYA